MPVIKHGSDATSAFKTIKVSGQSDVVADAGADDLTLVGGSNVTITTDASADSVTIAASGGGTLNGIDDQSSSNDDQITIKDTEVVINEDSADVDFRVEGNGDANLLVCNAGDDAVGIGTNTPNEKLVVSGNASVTGAIQITSNTSAPSAGAFIYRPASNTLALGSNSNERLRLTSDGRAESNFTAFAWGYYDDTQAQFQSLASGASHNFSSIAAGTTNSGTGTYKWTFSTAAPNATYAVVAGGDSDTTGYMGAIAGKTATGSFELFGSESGSFNDMDEVHVVVFAAKA